MKMRHPKLSNEEPAPKKPFIAKVKLPGRPRGPTPKGKKWSVEEQTWIVDPDAPQPKRKPAGPAQLGRPKGKAPKGKRWSVPLQVSLTVDALLESLEP